MIRLHVDADELAQCVACGLCLPHCPTWRVTGEEALSPRGRIEAMRQIEGGDHSPDGAFLHSIDTCVQCRGCETACPSGVPFGRLMEGTREALAEADRGYVSRRRRLLLRSLTSRTAVRAGTAAAALAQRLHLVPGRVALPPDLPLLRPRLRATSSGPGADAWLFTGCVMHGWQRHVHAAVLRVAAATGAGVALWQPSAGAACCGALHSHAGLGSEARRLALRVMASFPGEAAIIVDSAGCGAALKDYGRIIETPEAVSFSARVLDVHEWLAARLDRLPAPARRLTGVVAVQDPCHLRHVQRAHEPIRTVLRTVADIVELDDDGLCCGAGGLYSMTQPDLAMAIRARKLDAIARSGASVVASANPGCAFHLAAAGVEVRHPVELIDLALSGDG